MNVLREACVLTLCFEPEAVMVFNATNSNEHWPYGEWTDSATIAEAAKIIKYISYDYNFTSHCIAEVSSFSIPRGLALFYLVVV